MGGYNAVFIVMSCSSTFTTKGMDSSSGTQLTEMHPNSGAVDTYSHDGDGTGGGLMVGSTTTTRDSRVVDMTILVALATPSK